MTVVQRWTLAVVCTATAILMLDIAVVNTALPSIGEDLDTGIGGLQWVVDTYTLALAAVVLTAGSLADRFGRRRVFASGLVVFTVASGACAAADSIELLHAARAVQGLGAALLFATSLALLADAFPDERQRTAALAAYGATIGASFAIGPAVGGVLTTALGWRWVFLVNIPIGVAALAVTLRQVRESRDPRAPRVDVPGLLSLTSGLFLLVFGLLRGNEDGWGSGVIVAALAGAAALLVAFVVIEARSTHPMLPLALLRSRAFTGAQLTAFAISGSFFAIYLYCSIYLQNVLGLSAIEAGLVFVPSTLVMVVVSGATAQLSQRVHPGVLVSGGLLLVAAGMAMLTVAQVDSSWVVLLPGITVALIGTGLFNPSVSAVALNSVPAEQSGLAAGINDTFRQAGIAIGVAGLGALIPTGDLLRGGSAGDYVNGMHTALLAGAVLAASGAIAGALLIRRRDAEELSTPANVAFDAD
ncbi:MFS transporter [Solirubrobacter ginsenosidimutans]|uniref:MFS transporter n=1 Tax=Solirubrobacter ginsenosidimutans TaxID=490573 RepID=A0A9X3N0Q2_9ACTN|nr:MFS transporter [Solirubrobacter ginsenosidimutans]